MRLSAEAYAGDVTAREAWDLLSENGSAVLVDCRTRPEWSFVGIPDLGALEATVVFAEWQVFPSMAINAEFAVQLRAGGAVADAAGGRPLLFICRSGVRSKAAAMAMTQAGFGPCYNVSGGFEGPLDDHKHRGGSDGWKAAALPWIQE